MDNKRKYFKIVGWVLCSAMILCNEWVLALIFSSDGMLELSTRFKIWMFELILFCVGMSLILYGRGKGFRNTIRYYMNNRPRLFGISFGIVLTIFLLIVTEALFYILNHWDRDNYREEWTTSYYDWKADIIGYQLKPGIYTSGKKYINNSIIYKYSFTT